MPPWGNTEVTRERSLRDAPRADVVVSQVFGRPGWAKVLRRLRRDYGSLIVVDVDDLHTEPPAYNQSSRVTDKTLVGMVVAQLRAADVVTCATPFLAERFSGFNENVHVLRNYLDWGMWEDVTPVYEVERQRLRVGWRGNSWWKGGDLTVLRDVIPEFLRRHPEVDFVSSGGSDDVHDYLRVPADQRITYPRLAFHEMRVHEITAVMDVCLIPMRRNPFNEAKSHLTGLEMAASGIPVVVSPTESYRDYWLDDEIGFLAESPEEWTEALELLVTDLELRSRMGRAARKKASRHVIQEYAHEWEDLYGAELGKSCARRRVAA